jgi:hypothetical protein
MVLMRGVARNWRRLAVLGCIAGSAIVAYCVGRSGAAMQRAAATPPSAEQTQTTPVQQAPPTAVVADGSRSPVVAYLYGTTIPITRQEFGEFLIARQMERLDYLVNKRIIEHECQKKGITVSAAEVEQAILEDLGKMNVRPEDFLKTVLKRYNMNFYEWREDVVKPQLLMKKYVLSTGQVTVDDTDLLKAYESQFGDKVKCRAIVFPKTMDNSLRTAIWDRIRKSEEEFAKEARKQADPSLAVSGGDLGVISRHSMTDANVEKQVFSLGEGEVSPIFEDGPDRLIVFKCDKHIPAEEKNRPSVQELRKVYDSIILEVKTRDTIPKIFKEMREQASVKMLVDTPAAEKEWLARVKEMYKSPRDIDGNGASTTAMPQGN